MYDGHYLSENRISELLENASGYLGMIQEVQMKCRIVKEQIASLDVSDTQLEQYKISVGRMRSDLRTYSTKLKEVYEELRNNGIFDDVA